MRTIILFISLLLSFGRLNAQNYFTQWLKGIPTRYLGTQNIATDSKLNIYSIGMFSNTIDFDPGPGVYNLSPIDSTDGFILKLDSAGNFQWVIPIGGLKSIYIYCVTTDSLDNIIVAGNFAGSVDFDPSPATAIKVSVGDNSTFIAKYDVSGNLIWVNHIEGYTTVREIATNSLNQFFITGCYKDTVDFDPGLGTYKLYDSGGYLLSLNPDGSFNFCKKITHNGGAALYNIKTTKDNHILLGGVSSLSGTIDLDPSSSDYILSGMGYFIAYYSDTGAFQKALFFEGKFSPDISKSFDIKVNDFVTDKDNSIYITGSFSGTPDFDISADSFKLSTNKYGDAYLLKYDSSSKFVWAKSIGALDFDASYCILLDKLSNVYVSGIFTGIPDFDPGIGTKFTSSYGGRDLFIIRLTNSGDFDWVKTMGGIGNEYKGQMVMDRQDNLIQSGQFQSTAYFDDSGYFYLNTTEPFGASFIHKLRNTPLSQKEVLKHDELKIFPNPTNGILNLQFNGIEMSSIAIMDVLGKTVYTQNGKFRNDLTIDLRAYSLKGIYFIQAISENGISYFSSVIFE